MRSASKRPAKPGATPVASTVATLERGRAKDLLHSLTQTRVLMIGDVIIDEYHYGRVVGLSSETPTMVVADVEEPSLALGGAGLFCRNMLALGGTVKHISLIGGDRYNRYAKQFRHKNLIKAFIEDRTRKTTIKCRYWVADHKLFQWDQLDNRPIGPELQSRILEMIRHDLPNYDRLVVSDYRHGLIPEPLAADLVSLAKEMEKPISIDSQVAQSKSNHKWYTGANLFCVNEKEAKAVDPNFDTDCLEASLNSLTRTLEAEHVVVKLGADGCAALLDSTLATVAPPPTTIKDTAGAGDAFFAVLCLAPGPLTRDHLALANMWAALSTTIKGPVPPSLAMLDASLRERPSK